MIRLTSPQTPLIKIGILKKRNWTVIVGQGCNKNFWSFECVFLVKIITVSFCIKLKASAADPVYSSRILDRGSEFFHPGSRIPEVKRHGTPDPVSAKKNFKYFEPRKITKLWEI